MSTAKPSHDLIKWSDIDKLRFYGIGTAMYTVITLTLHPITVMKTRQQVLQTSFISSNRTAFLDKLRIYYRGVGIIILLAVPARGIYIGVLENSKEHLASRIQSVMTESSLLSSSSYFLSSSSSPTEEELSVTQKILLPLVASISGGLAGGIAAMSSQSITVPMDVISQRQMVMDDVLYRKEGSIQHVMKNILEKEGIAGFYKGFGLSLGTSLPTGVLWWGTYSGCQQILQKFEYFQQPHQQHQRQSFLQAYSSEHRNKKEMEDYIQDMIRRGLYQGICGISAAVIAATLTQPLDVIRTRLQVGIYGQQQSSASKASPSQLNNSSYSAVVKELYSSSGFRGFFRGTIPRVANFCIWGTVLSSAYEYLRHISRKDY